MKKWNFAHILKLFISTIFLILILSVSAFSSGRKMIALTFDDGPNKTYTPQVLEVLQKNNIKATFFVMGGWVKQNPEILKQVYAAGNVIGNHTFTHPLITKISSASFKNELIKTNEIIYATINVYPVLFRPPFGMSSATSNKIVSDLGFKKITWNFMVNDYDANKTTAEKIASQVIQHASPGAIITMHDGGSNREKTVKALATIIPTLKQKGYEFVTVSELLNIEPYRAKANSAHGQ